MARRTITLLVLATFACVPSGDEPTQLSSVGQDQSPIYGVYEATWQDDASDLTTSSIAGTVVKLRGGGAMCSGVLVARDTVLSAAHCRDTFVTVYVTNAGKTAQSFVRSHEIHPSYSLTDRLHHDVAVVKLSDPIPSDVVKNVAPVFFGDIEQAMQTGRLRGDPALIVGYGQYCPSGEDCGYGTRRKGYATEVKVASMLYGTVDPDVEAGISHGDSGGPIFMRDNRGVYHVVGVASYVSHYGSAWHDRWAVTGRGYLYYSYGTQPVDNGKWLLPRIGTHDDNDGVDDDIDNCAPWHCLLFGIPLERCFNPVQQDDDGDGVGDACDNCRATRECAGWNTLACWNPSQADFDGDGLGDVCDPCPEQDGGRAGGYWPRDWLDADGDEVGNECDLAPGHWIPHLACGDSAFCASRNAGFCAIEPGGPVGRCSRQPDSDGDEVEDSIDLCEGFFDPSNVNSNWIAENLRGVEQLGDMCDDVPVFRLAGQRDPIGVELGGFVFNEPFRAESMYGENAPGELEGRVVFRQCSCFLKDRESHWNTDIEVDDLECAWKYCDTDFAEFGLRNWRKITIEDETYSTIPGEDFLSPVEFRPGAPGGLRPFGWVWKEDIFEDYKTGVDWREAEGPVGSIAKTNGLLATVVADRMEKWTTDRDWENQLRVAAIRFRTPNAYWKSANWFFPADDTFRCIANPGCNLWIWDRWQEVINPHDWIVDPASFREPMAIFTDVDKLDLVAIDTHGGPRRIGASPDLVKQITQIEEQSWIPPSEPPDLLQRFSIDAKMVGLARWVAAEPTAVVMDGNMLALKSWLDLGGMSSGPPSLLLEEGVRPLYSAIERRVYLVGSNNEHDNAIRSYDLMTGIWDHHEWIDSHKPGMKPLAAAYDAAARKLFVLHVDVDNSNMLQIVEHQLAVRKSIVLWETRWNGQEGHLHELVVRPDRRLALIHFDGGRYSVCGFDPFGHAPAFEGMASGYGMPMGFPVPSREGIQFVVADGEHGTHTVVVHQGQKDPEVSCFW